MKRRIYLASSWKNDLQPSIVTVLRTEGHEVYDFENPTVGYDNPNPEAHGFHWSEIDGLYRLWNLEGYRRALRHPVAFQGFLSDWQAMQWANTCVLLLPSGRSAHLEAGYFVGAKKTLHILMLSNEEPELMYKMATSLNLSINELLQNLEEE